MVKNKIWHKDNSISFNKGDMVIVFRRKSNGHPKRLLDGKKYLVVDVINEDVVLEIESYASSLTKERYKVHKSYLITVDVSRDILISEFLKED